MRRRLLPSGSIPITATVCGVLFALVMLTASVLMSASRESDAVSVERQAQAASEAIESSIDDLALQQELVAIWDESVARLVPEVRELLWIHENVGLWLNLMFDHNEVFIVNGRDRPVYAAHDGKMVDLAHYHAVSADLATLLQSLREPGQGPNGKHDRNPLQPLNPDSSVRTTPRATHDSHLMLVQGRPAIASAMLIKPSTVGYVTTSGAWPALISVRYLDKGFLKDLAKRELMAGIRFSPIADPAGEERALLLETESGKKVGYLIWTPDLPGSRVAARLYPTSIAVMCVILLMLVFLARRLRSALNEAAAATRDAEQLASNDFLTGLPNRRSFQIELEKHCGATRNGTPTALVLLDLDDFKITNDTDGHDAGDALLQAIAERLTAASGEGDFVARLGGDEFAFLVGSAHGPAELEARGRELLAVLREPVPYKHKQVSSRASAGATFISAGMEASDALMQADLALYTSKGDGRDTFHLYQPSMLSRVRVRKKMLQLARQVLDEGIVVPYFQPKVNLRTGRIVGFEALLRCGLPDGQLFGPMRIAAALEDRSLASELRHRMADGVIAQMTAWRQAGLDFGHVAINASASDLNRPCFASNLLDRLSEAGLSATNLQVEVTESVLLGRNASHAMKALETLHEAGVKLALDDFGTGFASLSHLKLAAVDIIKVDKTFIANLQSNEEDAAIVRAMIDVAKALRLEIVAEGIETEAQRALLTVAGCEVGQGFYFCKALAGEEIPKLLASETLAFAAA